MEIDSSAKVCPICSYEFAGTGGLVRWVAILILLVFILYFLYQAVIGR